MGRTDFEQSCIVPSGLLAMDSIRDWLPRHGGADVIYQTFLSSPGGCARFPPRHLHLARLLYKRQCACLRDGSQQVPDLSQEWAYGWTIQRDPAIHPMTGHPPRRHTVSQAVPYATSNGPYPQID